MSEKYHKALRVLIPISSLNTRRFQRLVQSMSLKDVGKGQLLFKKGDTDRRAVFLLVGKVELRSETTASIVEAGTSQAKHALANLKPRQFTAKALTPVTIMHMSSRWLEKYLVWDQISRCASWEGMDCGPTERYETIEARSEEEMEWMFKMIKVKALRDLPAANIPKLFEKFEAFPVVAGQTIIRQKEVGDYYYVVREGQVAITRETMPGSEVTLATLSAGKSFGEESLIAGTPRNASAKALTDGMLMRLGKADFSQLVKEPLLREISYKDMLTQQSHGAVLLDVGLEDEFQHEHVPGSRNLPLYLLRLKVGQLERARRYILLSSDGLRSATAAFLMHEKGYHVSMLKGGSSNRLHGAAE